MDHGQKLSATLLPNTGPKAGRQFPEFRVNSGTGRQENGYLKSGHAEAAKPIFLLQRAKAGRMQKATRYPEFERMILDYCRGPSSTGSLGRRLCGQPNPSAASKALLN
jgi:hypothetical protein